MRYLLALVILVGGALGGFAAYRHLTAGPAVVLPAPTRLQASANGSALQAGIWTNSAWVTLAARPATQLVTGADFEVRRTGTPFTGQPSASVGDPSQVAQSCSARQRCSPPGAPAVHMQLGDGVYHWRVRFHNKDGISPWRTFRGTVQVDTQAPSPPLITSSTNPDPKRVYHSSTLRFSWQSADVGSGIQGYSYRLDGDPHGQASRDVRVPVSHVTLSGLDTGSYFFHVRALDRAGNWGAQATFPVGVDVTPPGLAHVRFNEFVFNPHFSPLHVSFAVTRSTALVRVGVYRQSDNTVVRLFRLHDLKKGQTTGVWWNGADAVGRLATPGMYKVYVRAVDRWGHSSLSGWSDFQVNYKWIVVSLSQQKMWVYDNGRLVRSSLVTTGNRALPTPTGTFTITAKFHPFTFHSPWKKSSPFYYPPSKVQYALLFREGGYFIHDAPWRSAFGPGTNAEVGTPGSNYTGTHGCINVPPDVAQWLYTWAPEGTVVQVVG